MIHSYKDLIVWQRSIELVVAIYELTEQFPKEEIYGLTSQMKMLNKIIRNFNL